MTKVFTVLSRMTRVQQVKREQWISLKDQKGVQKVTIVLMEKWAREQKGHHLCEIELFCESSHFSSSVCRKFCTLTCVPLFVSTGLCSAFLQPVSLEVNPWT